MSPKDESPLIYKLMKTDNSEALTHQFIRILCSAETLSLCYSIQYMVIQALCQPWCEKIQIVSYLVMLSYVEKKIECVLSKGRALCWVLYLNQLHNPQGNNS